MTFSWIPDSLKQQIADTVINFIGKQAEDLLGEQIGEQIKGFSSAGALRKTLAGAFERGVARFQHEYADIDEDLTAAILESPDFWDDKAVKQALLALASNPGSYRPQEHSAVAAHFEHILPGRRNRERVDRAIAALLAMIAEEIWATPGASEVRQLYALQMQRLSAEALQQQVALLRATLQATAQLGTEMRQTLLQLAGATEQRLLTSPPAAPSPPARPRPAHNLPQRNYGRFIGRQTELAKLTQLLLPNSRHFLVTLDGIGGVGKSTLALECAHRLREQATDQAQTDGFAAIIWVSAKRTLLTAGGIQQREQTFSTLSDLYRAIGIVLEQPGILQSDAEQRRGQIERALTAQRTLLIVDNLETVDDDELLTFLRELPIPTKAIITTRHRIDIAYAIRLAGMPKDDALALMAIEAARKNVALPVDHADDLYRRTGGIPLAIVWSIGLMSLGHGVEAVLRRLGSGHSDIARFCFTESVAGLQSSDTERLLLALSLFDASVSRTMIGEVAGLGSDEIGRDDGLALLEQLSLVNKEGDRFSLLPLTRTFATEVLRERAELEQELRGRWVDQLVAFAKPFNGLYWQWFDYRILLAEGPHLVAFVQWAQNANRLDLIALTYPALGFYYDMTAQWSEMVALGSIVLEHARLTGNLISIIYIQTHVIAWVLSQQGRHKEAEAAIDEALTAARRLDNVGWQCAVLGTYSQVLRRQRLFVKAMEKCQEAQRLVPLVDEILFIYVHADIEYEIGKVARDQGNWIAAREHFLNAQSAFRLDADELVFNRELAVSLLSNLGFIAQQLGNLSEAEQFYRQCLGYYAEMGGKGDLATTLVRLASLEEQRGNHHAAQGYATDAFQWSNHLGMIDEARQAEGILGRIRG